MSSAHQAQDSESLLYLQHFQVNCLFIYNNRKNRRLGTGFSKNFYIFFFSPLFVRYVDIIVNAPVF